MTTRPASDGAAEAPLRLDTDPARTLGWWAQIALWANLGISLFGPVTGALIALSAGSIPLAILAIVVGVALAGLLLGGSATFGAVTGAPAMVALRGLLGRHASVLPTLLNLAQNVGWATMEILLIATTAAAIVGERYRWVFVIVAGVVATLMAVRPLGSVAVLRRVMVWVVLVCSVVLFVQVLAQPQRPLDTSNVLGFWPAVDLAVAGVISFCPLAADYARHARSAPSAFGGAMIGYGGAAIAYFVLGALATVHLAGDLSGDRLITALVALPAGAIALFILMVDEVDEAFANIYSTTMSLHNLVPTLDRRVAAVGVGILATLLAGVLDFSQYQSFLFLIGSVFVPLFAVAVADFFLVSGRRWDVSATAPWRLAPVLAWLAGFVTYQVISPTPLPGWEGFWTRLREAAGLVPPAWLGSSVGAIVVSVVVAVVLGRLFALGRAVRG